jgi:hypothetical protein
MPQMLAVIVLALMGMTGKEREPATFIYELGMEPGGRVIDLPSWACGNITISGFDDSTRTMKIAVNGIPDDLPLARVWVVKPGEVHRIELLNGTSFWFYWKYEKQALGARTVALVVHHRCPAKGCAEVPGCEGPEKHVEVPYDTARGGIAMQPLSPAERQVLREHGITDAEMDEYEQLLAERLVFEGILDPVKTARLNTLIQKISSR